MWRVDLTEKIKALVLQRVGLVVGGEVGVVEGEAFLFLLEVLTLYITSISITALLDGAFDKVI